MPHDQPPEPRPPRAPLRAVSSLVDDEPEHEAEAQVPPAVQASGGSPETTRALVVGAIAVVAIAAAFFTAKRRDDHELLRVPAFKWPVMPQAPIVHIHPKKAK